MHFVEKTLSLGWHMADKKGRVNCSEKVPEKEPLDLAMMFKIIRACHCSPV